MKITIFIVVLIICLLMKNFKILLFICLLFITACGDTVKVIDSNFKTSTDLSIDSLPNNISYIQKYTFEEHEYIYFEFNIGYSRTGGVVHNPECSKCKHIWD